MVSSFNFLSIFLVIASLLGGLYSWPTVLAQVMTSTNYQIQSDSLNLGGGYGTSTNYQLESTLGEIATGNSSSSNFAMYAGYQQMQSVFISMSLPTDVILLPALPGITGGTATGSTAVSVVTDSPAGYQLTLKAENSPAMQSLNGNIADYTPVGAEPDFIFSVDPTTAELGFSPEGSDTALRYQDNGSVCNVSGGDTSDRCWDALSTSERIIASATDANHPSGATTTIKFQVESGGLITVIAGQYVATTTLTALPL